VQTNLVSDGFVAAAHTDSNLVNSWGLAASPTGPFWVADNGTGVTTIYDGAGNPKMVGGNSAITIAAPPGQTSSAAPTGAVFKWRGKRVRYFERRQKRLLGPYLCDRGWNHLGLEP
jgi:hypothetical protein